MYLYSFEKLEVYKKALDLVSLVYIITKKFPSDEKFGLTNQLRRAIISVPSNIAESCGRISLKEKIHFLEISYGSILESFCQIQIAKNLNYISDNTLSEISPKFHEVSTLINGLSNSYKKQLNYQAGK